MRINTVFLLGCVAGGAGVMGALMMMGIVSATVTFVW